MSSLFTVIALCFTFLFSLVFADTDCVYTKTIQPSTTLSSTARTDYIIYYDRSTTTQFPSVINTFSSTTITTHTTSTIYTPSSTTFYTTVTTTLRASNLKFSACPTTPKFVKRCPTVTTVTTSLPEKTFYSTTGIANVTYIFPGQLETSYLSSTVIRSTYTTGNPPTTRITSKTIRPSTSIVYVETSYTTKYDKTETSTYYPRTTLTSTKTILPPSATATPKLFSLQVTNSSFFLDGLTVGVPAADGTALVQKSTPAKFYIDPPTGWLVETTTKKHLSWYNSCRWEDPPCDNVLRFAPDTPESGSLGSYTTPLKCTVSCGQNLKCDGVSFVVHTNSAGPLENGTLYTSTVPTAGQGGNDTTHLLIVSV